MTSFDSKGLLGFQKMRTHVTMVFAWGEPADIFLYCDSGVTQKTNFIANVSQVRIN